MEREQFTFYASFAKAARKIRKPAERCAFYDAVIDFALSGISPEEGSLPDVVEMAMELVAPVLSSARRKAEAGRNGGKNASEKAEAKTDLLPKKPKQGENASKKEGEDKKEKEDKCPISPPSPSPEEFFSGDLLAAVTDWLSYKRERRESYKPTGIKMLFAQLRKAAGEHGDAAVAEVIRSSMASGYQGITLDRLSSRTQAKKPKSYTTAADYVPPSTSWEDLEKVRKEFKR